MWGKETLSPTGVQGAKPLGALSVSYTHLDVYKRQEREEFTQVFFDLLAASRAETLSEFSQSWADSALAVAGAYAALPPAVRRDMLDYLWRFLVNMGTGGKG